jgi:hypothetical protein
VVVFDEGVSHIAFNLIDYSGGFHDMTKSLFLKLKPILQYVSIIVVDDSSNDIKKRLIRRGHKRLKVDVANELDAFVRCNERVVQSLKCLSTNTSFAITTYRISAGSCDPFIKFVEKLIQE